MSGMSREGLSTPNVSEESKARLRRAVWGGDYKSAISFVERLLAGERQVNGHERVLVPYASTYYSAASRIWGEKPRGTVLSAVLAATYLGKAIRALDERIEIEKSRHNVERTTDLGAFEFMTPAELDVIATVYSRPAEAVPKRVQKIANALLQVVFMKTPTGDFFADSDTRAMAAARKALEHIARADPQSVSDPHTEIFVLSTYASLVERSGDKTAVGSELAARLLEAGDRYPWPPVIHDHTLDSETLTKFGQAARVARKLADTARKHSPNEESKYTALVEKYTAHVPDQKVKAETMR